ncbi:hypothetical protein IGK47_000051 [Enterococcus sp. AZ007]
MIKSGNKKMKREIFDAFSENSSACFYSLSFKNIIYSKGTKKI